MCTLLLCNVGPNTSEKTARGNEITKEEERETEELNECHLCYVYIVVVVIILVDIITSIV